MYAVRIDMPSIPYPSYVWGDRFTSDFSTATKFHSVGDAVHAEIRVVGSIHLDAKLSVVEAASF